MKQIQPRAKNISLMHNICPKGGGEYRLMRFCIKQEVSETEHLLFNYMTKEMLLLSDEDMKDLSVTEYLKKHLFLVPEGTDDHELALRVREFFRQIRPKVPPIGYTIFTTTKCNARCFYCFEQKWEQSDMDEQTAMQVARYITERYEDLKKIPQCRDKKISIGWFGGEPLCNTAPIHTICEELKENGVEFISRMTTNGYLLNADMLKHTKEWHLKSVQITMDGTEHIYNKVKNYTATEKGESPYKVVMGNIRLALEAGVKVSVRINLSQSNYDDLYNLTKELVELYSGYKNFHIYCALLMESCSAYETQLLDPTREQLRDQKKSLTRYIVENGCSIDKDKKLPDSIHVYACMADGREGIVVLPNGDLTLCEHYNKDMVIGHISAPDVLNKEVIGAFREEYERTPLCDDCPLFPNCIRLKKCEYKGECSELKKQMNIDGTKEKMLKTYEAYKCKHEEELT